MKNTNTKSIDSTINFSIMVRFDGHVEELELRSALDRLKGRHRAFDVCSSSDIYHPDAPNSCPFPIEIIPYDLSTDWKSIVAQELARPFDRNSPRARFVLIKKRIDDELLVVCDHDGTDGLSAINLLEDLVLLLNNPDTLLIPLPVPPPVWNIVPIFVKTSLSWKVKQLFIFVMFSTLAFIKNTHKKSTQPRNFTISSLDFSADFTEHLEATCKKEKTSVHAAVCTAWLFSLEPSMAKNKSIRSVSSPVSLRKYLLPEFRSCAGMYYTTTQSIIDKNSTNSFWNSAREIKRQVSDAETKPSFFDMPLTFKTLSWIKMRQPMNKSFHMPDIPIKYDFSITNLGKISNFNQPDQEKPSRYTVDAIYGPIVNAFSGEKTVGISTFEEKMRITLTTFSNEMDSTQSSELITKVKCLLEDCLSTQ